MVSGFQEQAIRAAPRRDPVDPLINCDDRNPLDDDHENDRRRVIVSWSLSQ